MDKNFKQSYRLLYWQPYEKRECLLQSQIALHVIQKIIEKQTKDFL